LNRSDKPAAACEYPQSAVRIGANKRFADAYPQINELLVNWRLSNEDIVDAIIDAHTTKKPMSFVAETFVRLRHDVWTPWVSHDIVAAIKATMRN
jgi:ABC-type proline/glycine betaine transport system substrate-binding protein